MWLFWYSVSTVFVRVQRIDCICSGTICRMSVLVRYVGCVCCGTVCRLFVLVQYVSCVCSGTIRSDTVILEITTRRNPGHVSAGKGWHRSEGTGALRLAWGPGSITGLRTCQFTPLSLSSLFLYFVRSGKSNIYIYIKFIIACPYF